MGWSSLLFKANSSFCYFLLFVFSFLNYRFLKVWGWLRNGRASSLGETTTFLTCSQSQRERWPESKRKRRPIRTHLNFPNKQTKRKSLDRTHRKFSAHNFSIFNPHSAVTAAVHKRLYVVCSNALLFNETNCSHHVRSWLRLLASLALPLLFFPSLCPVTHKHTHIHEGGCGQRQDGDRQERTDRRSRWMKRSLAHWLETESSQLHLTPQDAHTHAFHLNQLCICRFHLTGIRRTEGANHLSLSPVLLMYVRLISVVVGLLCHSFHFPPHQDHFHISRTSWRGRTLDDGVIHHPYHPAISCSVTGACSSLWPHPTPFLTSTALPPSLRLWRLRLAPLAALSLFLFFLFFCNRAGVPQHCGVLHACPVFLLAPVLAGWKRRWGC